MAFFKTQSEFNKTFKGVFSNSTQAKTLARGKAKAKKAAILKKAAKRATRNNVIKRVVGIGSKLSKYF